MKKVKLSQNGGGLYEVSQVTARKSTKRRSSKRKGTDFLSYVEGVGYAFLHFQPNTTIEVAVTTVNKQLREGDRHVFTKNAEKIAELIASGQRNTLMIY